jgi:predicted permease
MMGIVYSINIFFALLLAVICSNVATLVFARTSSRAWEITVRNALGASRGRIVSQLFVEALILASLGAIIGLAGAALLMRQSLGMLRAQGSLVPFWFVPGMSTWTMLYAVLLTLFGASIVGILPALRLTRQGIQSVLQREGLAKSGVRFGGFWTSAIVVQVAITVALIPFAAGGALLSNRFERRAEALNAEKYLSARLDLEPEIPPRNSSEAAAFAARSKDLYRTLEQRLIAEPEVEAVAFADRLPGSDQFKFSIELDAQTTSPDGIRIVTSALVARGFFHAFGVEILAGRDFNASDGELEGAVIVNQSFVRHVLRDRNPIGQRIRFNGGSEGKSSDRWYEIVGMVQDLGSSASEESPVEASAVYIPITPGQTTSVRLAVRTRGNPNGIAPQLREIAAAVDPTMRVHDVVPLAEIGGQEAQLNWLLTSIAWVAAFMTLVLSATGIHALMAFTVARRTREIGIRAALGAQPHRIVVSIFFRAFVQLGLGVLAGSGLAVLLGLGTARGVFLLLIAVGIMLTVGLGACAVPLRRALRIDPTEALRTEG